MGSAQARPKVLVPRALRPCPGVIRILHPLPHMRYAGRRCTPLPGTGGVAAVSKDFALWYMVERNRRVRLQHDFDITTYGCHGTLDCMVVGYSTKRHQ